MVKTRLDYLVLLVTSVSRVPIDRFSPRDFFTLSLFLLLIKYATDRLSLSLSCASCVCVCNTQVEVLCECRTQKAADNLMLLLGIQRGFHYEILSSEILRATKEKEITYHIRCISRWRGMSQLSEREE